MLARTQWQNLNTKLSLIVLKRKITLNKHPHINLLSNVKMMRNLKTCYLKPLRLMMSRKVSAQDVKRNASFAPVRIMAGALGNGLPKRDLLVSRQHRMLVSSRISARMFGKADVLVAAIRLTELPGVFVEPDHGAVEYFHLLFDKHEVIYAEGAPSESFYLGAEALKSLTPDARAEVALLFPHVFETTARHPAARPIPSGPQQKTLIARHSKNKKAYP